MAFVFDQLPSAIWPTPTQPVAKDTQVKAVKLTNSDFSTGGTANVRLYLPSDASIISVRTWVKTQLAGGGITAATLSIGVTGTATKYVNAVSVFGAAGVFTMVSPLTNIFQTYDPTVPAGDIALLFTGTATTGNPTSGELYVLVEYIR